MQIFTLGLNFEALVAFCELPSNHTRATFMYLHLPCRDAWRP